VGSAHTLDGDIQTDCLTSTSPSDTYGPCSSTTYVIYPSSCTGPSACSSGPIPVVFVPTGTSSALVTGAATGPGVLDQAVASGFPFYNPTNYEAWAGTCADAQPASSFIEGLTSVPGSTGLIWPGNPNVTLFAQPLTLVASNYGTNVTATHVADSNCTLGEKYTYAIPSNPKSPPATR